MAKKIFGITDTGEQIELSFQKFLILTENDSKLELEILNKESQHPEKPDLSLNILTGPLVKVKTSEGPEEKFHFKATEGARYFSVLPGANNLIFIKVIRKAPD